MKILFFDKNIISTSSTYSGALKPLLYVTGRRVALNQFDTIARSTQINPDYEDGIFLIYAYLGKILWEK